MREEDYRLRCITEDCQNEAVTSVAIGAIQGPVTFEQSRRPACQNCADQIASGVFLKIDWERAIERK